MNNVICPYCNEEFEIDTCELFGGEEFIDECPYCEKEIEVYAEAVLDISASKPRYFICEICGKKEYEVAKRYEWIEKSDGKREIGKICPECYTKEIEKVWVGVSLYLN